MKRRLTCDNCGWQVEVCDDNVRTVNINRKEWVRKTADHNSIKKREKSVVHYHKLADIIKTSRSQYASGRHKFSKVHFMVLSYSAQVQVTDFLVSSSGDSAGVGEGGAAGASGAGRGAGAGGGASSKGLVNGKSVSFYGVVIDHTHPQQTRGTDYHTGLTVIDDTCTDGIKINCFMDLAQTSPQVLLYIYIYICIIAQDYGL